jgi:hypothetical protein
MKKYIKFLDILIILFSARFITIGFIKYIIRHQFSFADFVISELFFSICLIVALLSLFDKISSLNNIVSRSHSRIGDYLLYICGFLFGLSGVCISLFWISNKIIKIISLIGSFFFIFGSIFVFITDYLMENRGREPGKPGTPRRGRPGRGHPD